MKFRRRRTYIKSLESTALTDIVFLLLIFFLLTSSFVNHIGIKVSLPGVKNPVKHELKKNVSVSINNKGRIFLNDQVVSMETLPELLKKIMEKDQEKIIVFRPDKNIKVDKLVEVMDIANSVGAYKLIIATKEKKK